MNVPGAHNHPTSTETRPKSCPFSSLPPVVSEEQPQPADSTLSQRSETMLRVCIARDPEWRAAKMSLVVVQVLACKRRKTLLVERLGLRML